MSAANRAVTKPSASRTSDCSLSSGELYLAAVVAASDDSLTFRIIVAPRSSRSRFGPVVGDAIKIAVTEPPVNGKANSAVVQLVARTLGVRKADVTITAGTQGKRKNVRVVGVTAEDLRRKL